MASSKRRKKTKSNTLIRQVGAITPAFIKKIPRGSRESLSVVEGFRFWIAIQPAEDMDALLEEYAVPANVSDIEPFERVRDMLAFYTGEAGRANLALSFYRSERRRLRRLLGKRKGRVVRGLPKGVTKWRSESEVSSDDKLQEYEKALQLTEDLVDLLEVLRDNYRGYADALLYEKTARQNDRERWQGAAGSGR